jgi:hypothetical protein
MTDSTWDQRVEEEVARSGAYHRAQIAKAKAGDKETARRLFGQCFNCRCRPATRVAGVETIGSRTDEGLCDRCYRVNRLFGPCAVVFVLCAIPFWFMFFFHGPIWRMPFAVAVPVLLVPLIIGGLGVLHYNTQEGMPIFHILQIIGSIIFIWAAYGQSVALSATITVSVAIAVIPYLLMWVVSKLIPLP